MIKLALVGPVVAAAACTTLGPVPVATGVAPLPAGRPGVEVQIAAAPGYFLSSGVSEEPKGAGMPQLSALFEPDRLIGVPGLIVAGRLVGGDDANGIFEPMLGYRRALDDRFALSALLHGTHGSGESAGASYEMTMAGLELGLDMRVTPVSRVLELHAVLGAAALALSAEGDHCVESTGRFAVTCPAMPTAEDMRHTEADGVYPTGQVGLMLDSGRHFAGAFHGVRLGALLAFGTMPRAIGGAQVAAEPFASLGLLLSVGLGGDAAR